MKNGDFDIMIYGRSFCLNMKNLVDLYSWLVQVTFEMDELLKLFLFDFEWWN